MSANAKIPIDYKTSSQEALTFQLVYNDSEVDKPIQQLLFQPEMSYQIFGDKETIFGYKNLSIKLCYAHNSSHCLLKVIYSHKIKDFEPDDIENILSEWYPGNLITNVTTFKKLLRNEKHDRIYGREIHKFEKITEVSALNGDKIKCEYIITECDVMDNDFREFHEKFETFVIWFIEAANYIDLDDPRWIIFYVFEKFVHPKTGETFVTPIGFNASYKYFYYPESNRARISQFFILPTHQGKGIGSELYSAVYKQILQMPDIMELTVENPVQKFQSMRDLCDSIFIYNDLKLQNKSISVHLKSQKSLFSYMLEKKICKKQAQRISHILHLHKALAQGEDAAESFKNSLREWIRNDFERDIGISRNSKSNFKNAARLLLASQLNVDIQELDVESRLANYISQIEPVVKKLNTVLK